ncbi:MAG: hypothetical protein M1834_009006, partial [Cirrosporium novae-zelandiae]
QHSRDKDLLQGVAEFLSCGSYVQRKDKQAGDFKVFKIKDITQKIIPFFLKYPLMGSKSLQFNTFRLVAEIVEKKGHLTEEGIKTIQDLKS